MAEEGRVHILPNYCQVAIDCGSYEVYMHINLYKISAGWDGSFGGHRYEVSLLIKSAYVYCRLVVCSRMPRVIGN